MTVAIIISMLWTATAPAATANSLSSFRCDTAEAAPIAPNSTLYPTYIKHSVAIMQAALRGDTILLRRFVAQDATAAFYHYDNGASADSTGSEAVMEMVRRVAPVRYEYFEPRGLPGPNLNPCGMIDIRLILKPAHADKAFLATFRYNHGMLVNLNLNDADFAAGNVTRRSIR